MSWGFGWVLKPQGPGPGMGPAGHEPTPSMSQAQDLALKGGVQPLSPRSATSKGSGVARGPISGARLPGL